MKGSSKVSFYKFYEIPVCKERPWPVAKLQLLQGVASAWSDFDLHETDETKIFDFIQAKLSFHYPTATSLEQKANECLSLYQDFLSSCRNLVCMRGDITVRLQQKLEQNEHSRTSNKITFGASFINKHQEVLAYAACQVDLATSHIDSHIARIHLALNRHHKSRIALAATEDKLHAISPSRMMLKIMPAQDVAAHTELKLALSKLKASRSDCKNWGLQTVFLVTLAGIATLLMPTLVVLSLALAAFTLLGTVIAGVAMAKNKKKLKQLLQRATSQKNLDVAAQATTPATVPETVGSVATARTLNAATPAMPATHSIPSTSASLINATTLPPYTLSAASQSPSLSAPLNPIAAEPVIADGVSTEVQSAMRH